MKLAPLAILFVPSLAAASPGAVGADVEVLPSGTIEASAFGFSGSTDADVAWGVGLDFDHDVDPHVTVGFVPRLLFNVNGQDSNNDASTELDLRVRGAFGTEIAPGVRVYGFAAPGYSILFPPSSDDPHPHGFVAAIGAGASYDLGPALRAFFELGYQWGFQKWHTNDAGFESSGDFETRYLGLSFGLSTLLE